MTDQFARELAKESIKIARDTRRALDAATKQPTVQRLPGLCALCGAPIRKGRLYCHAHSWAG
jgi:hypothetical protein